MNVEAVRLFGSKVRSEVDELSDTDILVVGASDGFEKGEIDKKLKDSGHIDISYSFYGKKRIQDMFEEGHLFAWHLFYESCSLLSDGDFIDFLGKPNPYKNAISDITEFLRLLENIAQNVKESKFNSIYECGILYVCSRNIALCSSMILQGKPDFSRNSPYNLSNFLGKMFPLTREDYNSCLVCRKKGMQGLASEPIANLLKKAKSVIEWGHTLRKRLKNV